MRLEFLNLGNGKTKLAASLTSGRSLSTFHLIPPISLPFLPIPTVNLLALVSHIEMRDHMRLAPESEPRARYHPNYAGNGMVDG